MEAQHLHLVVQPRAQRVEDEERPAAVRWPAPSCGPYPARSRTTPPRSPCTPPPAPIPAPPAPRAGPDATPRCTDGATRSPAAPPRPTPDSSPRTRPGRTPPTPLGRHRRTQTQPRTDPPRPDPQPGTLVAQRLVDWYEILAAERPGAGLGLRPWRIAAGVCLGAACAVKWSGIFFLIGFAVMSLLWDAGARRAVGLREPYRGALAKDLPPSCWRWVSSRRSPTWPRGPAGSPPAGLGPQLGAGHLAGPGVLRLRLDPLVAELPHAGPRLPHRPGDHSPLPVGAVELAAAAAPGGVLLRERPRPAAAPTAARRPCSGSAPRSSGTARWPRCWR